MFSENILDIIELVLFTHSSVWSNDTSSDAFRCIDCCLSVVLKFTIFGSINPCSYTLKVLGLLEVKKTMWYRDNQWYESLLMQDASKILNSNKTMILLILYIRKVWWESCKHELPSRDDGIRIWKPGFLSTMGFDFPILISGIWVR